MTSSSAKRRNRNSRAISRAIANATHRPYLVTSFIDSQSDKFNWESANRLADAMRCLRAETNMPYLVALLNQQLREERGQGRVRPRPPMKLRSLAAEREKYDRMPLHSW